MGNEQTSSDSSISPKVKTAINAFTQTLSEIESSKEQRSFILDCTVPKQFGNDFNLNQWINIAKYVLENDKIVSSIRQKCVPSLIKENEFWKKYFYIVSEQKKKAKKRQKKSEQKTDENTPKTDEIENKQKTDEKDTNDSDTDSDYDTFQVLLHKPIIWLYKIPATIWRGRNNKCELWSLRNPIWMGRLRIVAYNHGKTIEFQFLEKDGKLFLKSTKIKLDEINDDDNPIHEYFDAYGVIDSSRYFIVWVDVPSKKPNQKNSKNKKIPFGFGIRERLDAFDIRACVADQTKIVRRPIESELRELSTDSSDSLAQNRKNRFELSEDEMISIGHDIHGTDIDTSTSDGLQPIKHRHSTILKVNTAAVSVNSDAYLLPPPPSPPLTPKDELTHISNIDHHITVNHHNFVVSYADEDFGDFQTANVTDELDNTQSDVTVETNQSEVSNKQMSESN